MNIRNLKYLIALDEYRHFGKAAKACFISQPALSMQIKKLEEVLEIKLLERNNKSVFLTDCGLAVTECARQILQKVEELYEIGKLAKNPYSGELKIGVIPTLAPYFLPLIIPHLSKFFPNVSFYLMEEQTSFLIEKLKIGKLDAAFLALPIMENYLTHSMLFKEEFLLAVPNIHRLAKRRTINPAKISAKNLLLLEEGHCMRGQALAFCRKMKDLKKQTFSATSLETLRHMVAAGVGITLMPKLAQKSNDGISYISFDSPKPSRSIALFWRMTTTKSLLLNEITKQIRKTMKQENMTTN